MPEGSRFPRRFVLDEMDEAIADHFDIDIAEDLHDPQWAPMGYFVQIALNERGERAIRDFVARGGIIVWEEGAPIA